MKLKITTFEEFDFLRGNATSRSSYRHDTDNITNEHIELCTNNLQIISMIAHESFRDLMTLVTLPTHYQFQSRCIPHSHSGGAVPPVLA